jgi:hypothetical protein
MEAKEEETREKEHFVFSLRKYTWERKENLLNKTRRENMHVNKILELYKIMPAWIIWELKTFLASIDFYHKRKQFLMLSP